MNELLERCDKLLEEIEGLRLMARNVEQRGDMEGPQTITMVADYSSVGRVLVGRLRSGWRLSHMERLGEYARDTFKVTLKK